MLCISTVEGKIFHLCRFSNLQIKQNGTTGMDLRNLIQTASQATGVNSGHVTSDITGSSYMDMSGSYTQWIGPSVADQSSSGFARKSAIVQNIALKNSLIDASTLPCAMLA